MPISKIFRKIRIGALAAGMCLLSGELHGEDITLLAGGLVSAETLDHEGETLGGFGSGISYDPKTGDYLFIQDRGAGDGAIDFRPRYQVCGIRQNGNHLIFENKKTVLFKDENGKPFTGLIPNAGNTQLPQMQDGRNCLDPEAIAVAPDGTIYISEEYGPAIYQFQPDGTFLRRIEAPENYRPRANGTLDFSHNRDLTSGRVTNHGFEGMTITPDGKEIVLAIQGPLTQDNSKDCRLGRILRLDLASGKPIAEYAYPFEKAEEINAARQLAKKHALKQKHLDVSELLSIDSHRFLVLERDDRGPNGTGKAASAEYKAIWLIDTANATNLLDLPGQPYDLLPNEEGFRSLADAGAEIHGVQKTLLLNLADQPLEKVQFSRDMLSEKWEGMAWRPDTAPDTGELLISSDNDFCAPILHFANKEIAFPRAKVPLPTQLLLFKVKLP